MATMHQLVDITKSSWGGTAIARATEARVSLEEQRLRHNSGTLLGPSAVDTVQRTIRARLTAEDPLVLPTLLAISGLTGSLIAGGRLVNATSYEDLTLLRAILTGFGMSIVDNQAGTLSLDFINRATEGSDIDDEYSVASGTKQAFATSKNTIRIRAEAAFTDDATTELALPGIESINIQAAPQQIHTACSNPAAAANSNLCDVVDPMDWFFTGSLVLRDATIASTQDLAVRLAGLLRGDLVVPCMLSGVATDATPPADKIITFKRVKFHSPSRSFRSKGPASSEIPFDAVVLAADGSTELTLAQMITMADDE